RVPLARRLRRVFLGARPGVRRAAALPVPRRRAPGGVGGRRQGGRPGAVRARGARGAGRIPGLRRTARGARPVVRRAAAIAAALLLGCAGAGGVDRAELPDAPIALLHRSEEEALRRVDALRDLGKRTTGSGKEGVATLENLDGLLGGAPRLERRLGGGSAVLMLLDPRTGALQRIETAPPHPRPAGWSPDRRRLLVSGTWRGRRQLFVWERETGRIEIVTAGPAHHVNGCFAAGDRLVALAVEREALEGAPSQLVASAPGGGALRPVGAEDF